MEILPLSPCPFCNPICPLSVRRTLMHLAMYAGNFRLTQRRLKLANPWLSWFVNDQHHFSQWFLECVLLQMLYFLPNYLLLESFILDYGLKTLFYFIFCLSLTKAECLFFRNNFWYICLHQKFYHLHCGWHLQFLFMSYSIPLLIHE